MLFTDAALEVCVVEYQNIIDNILITKNCNQHYLWVCRHDTSKLKIRHPPKLTQIEGQWYTLDAQLGVTLPDTTNHEAVADLYAAEKVSSHNHSGFINCNLICFLQILP